MAGERRGRDFDTRTATWDLRYAYKEGEIDLAGGSGEELGNRYLLRTCLNVGGCGEIWEALQVSLNRVVAVKRIHSTEETDPRTMQWLRWQFRQEALITARLDHPNILPVHDLGTDAAGTPVLAMKLVRGTPWTNLIRRDREQLTWEDFLERHISILAEVCNAVAFAHSRGVVHRDLKPSQVMVGEFGEVLLMDWGLAVYIGDESDEETVGVLDVDLPTPLTAVSPAGTPNMMAPEQTEESADNITPATDIYLLGGILYYILTETYPHHSPSSDESMAMARIGMIEPLETRASGVDFPQELKALTLHSLARHPGQRPSSAEEFHKRLKEYQRVAVNRRESNRLVRQASTILDHLVESKLSTSTSPSVSTLIPNAGGGSMTEVYEKLNDVLALLDRARGSWLRNPDIVPCEVRAITAYADAAIRQRDYTLARVMCARLNDPRIAGDLGRRIEEEQAKGRRHIRQRKTALAFSGVLAGIFALAALIHAVKLYEANRELEIQRDTASNRAIELQVAEETASRERAIAEAARAHAERLQYYSSIAYAATTLDQYRGEVARHTLTNDIPLHLRGWEWGHLLARLHPESAILQNEQQIFHAEFSPDGRFIATGDARHVSLYDAASARMVWSTRTGDAIVWSLQFNGDGSLLAASTFDGEGLILNVANGDILRRFPSHGAVVRDVAFSPHGDVLVTAARDGGLRFFDIESGDLLLDNRDHARSLYTVRFSPDGSRIATSSLDRSVILRDAETLELLHRVPLGGYNSLSAHFSPDGRQVVATDTGGHFHVIDVATGSLLRSVKAPDSYLHDAIYTPDGSTIITASEEGKLRFWDAESGELVHRLFVDNPIWKIRVSPCGHWLAVTTRRSLRLVDLDRVWASLRPAQRVEDEASVPLSGVDRLHVHYATTARIATWAERHAAWRSERGYHLFRVDGDHLLVQSGFSSLSPDGTLLGLIDEETLAGEIRDRATSEVLHRTSEGVPHHLFAFDPNQARVAVGEQFNRVHLLTTGDWETLFTFDLRDHREFGEDERAFLDAVVFDPDSRRIGILFFRYGLYVLDAKTGDVLHHFNTPHGALSAAVFSPDGRFIATGDYNDDAVVFSLETGELVQQMIGHTGLILQQCYNADGTRLLTLGAEGAVKIWDTASGRELATVHASPNIWSVPLAIGFSGDGARIQIATRTGEIRILDAVPWEESSYADLPGETFEQKFEIWKRRTRFHPGADLDDLTVIPAVTKGISPLQQAGE